MVLLVLSVTLSGKEHLKLSGNCRCQIIQRRANISVGHVVPGKAGTDPFRITFKMWLRWITP